MKNIINGLSSLEFSRRHCNKQLDCSWYHGSWHLLKALGVVSTSAIHEHSLEKLIQLAVADMSAVRILVTGSSDETLVRIAQQSCQALGIDARLTAVDICATPLAFMQAFADEHRIELETCRSDILEFEPVNRFDIILTHAFMGYFDDVQRPALVNRWRQLLTDRGRIITIQRVRPADSPALVRFTPEQSARFVATAIEAAQASGQYQPSEIDAIQAAASDFAKNFVNHAITSRTALESLFIDADLDFQVLEYHHLEQKGELSGPSVPSNAEFAHIVAKKSEVIHGR